jgi:chromosome segregation ATPase
MTTETVTWLYASLGASLFVLGGVSLRSMAVARVRQELLRLQPELEQARGRLQVLERSREELERSSAEAKRREREAVSALQAREAEWMQQLASAERVAHEARQRSEQLAADATAGERLMREMDASVAGLRSELASAQNELQQARQAVLAAEERARTAAMRGVPAARLSRDSSPAVAPASSRGETLELRRSLETAVKERDAAKAKAEALERLVEGVRARSRELASELNRLKGASS